MDKFEAALCNSFSSLTNNQKIFFTNYIVNLANAVSDTRILTNDENTLLKLFSFMDETEKINLIHHTAGYLVGRNIISLEESVDILLKKD